MRIDNGQGSLCSRLRYQEKPSIIPIFSLLYGKELYRWSRLHFSREDVIIQRRGYMISFTWYYRVCTGNAANTLIRKFMHLGA